MKICLTNTHDNLGGATIAAQRLAAGLRLHSGVGVDFVSRFTGDIDGFLTDLQERDDTWIDSVAAEEMLRMLIAEKQTPRCLSIFSSTGPACDISAHDSVASADVINLHWVTRFLNHESIERLHRLGKPIVWTLHDMRAFTGGCHYAGDCDGFEAGCGECPQIDSEFEEIPRANKKLVDSALEEIPITFVCPSRWLAQELRRSRLFQSSGKSVEVIPYGLDTDCFKPAANEAEREALRRQFDIPEKRFCMIAGAHTWKEPRKGGEALQEAMKQVGAEWRDHFGASAEEPVLVLYGQSTESCQIDGIETVQVGKISGEEAMASLLGCGDLYLTMSREDNLPCSVMEALACGLPVAATATGGIPDMVEEGVTGKLVEQDDSAGMAAAILEAASDPARLREWSENAREKVLADYRLELQGERYLELFRKLAAEAKTESIPSRSDAKGPFDIIPSPLTKDALAVFGARKFLGLNLESKRRLQSQRTQIENLKKRLEQQPSADAQPDSDELDAARSQLEREKAENRKLKEKLEASRDEISKIKQSWQYRPLEKLLKPWRYRK